MGQAARILWAKMSWFWRFHCTVQVSLFLRCCLQPLLSSLPFVFSMIDSNMPNVSKHVDILCGYAENRRNWQTSIHLRVAELRVQHSDLSDKSADWLSALWHIHCLKLAAGLWSWELRCDGSCYGSCSNYLRSIGASDPTVQPFMWLWSKIGYALK